MSLMTKRTNVLDYSRPKLVAYYSRAFKQQEAFPIPNYLTFLLAYTDDSWSTLLCLLLISLKNVSSSVLLIFKERPAAGTVVQSDLFLHLLNFAVGSSVWPFWTKKSFYQGII